MNPFTTKHTVSDEEPPSRWRNGFTSMM